MRRRPLRTSQGVGRAIVVHRPHRGRSQNGGIDGCIQNPDAKGLAWFHGDAARVSSMRKRDDDRARRGRCLRPLMYLDRLIRDLRLKNRPTLKGCHQHKIREQAHDQIDSFCGLRLSRYHVSSGNDCRASSRAGRYDHASCLGMRTGHDAN